MRKFVGPGTRRHDGENDMFVCFYKVHSGDILHCSICVQRPEFECMKAVCDLNALSVSDFKRFKPSHSAMDFMAVAARLCSGMVIVGRETCQIDNPGPKAHQISGRVDVSAQHHGRRAALKID
jgi:hypothetical protein